MKSITKVGRNSFLFSNNLISNHQFGFRAGHSTLDMLLLLIQQWMEAFNVRRETRAISLDISRAFDTVWHPALLSQVSAYGIQGQLHTWLPDFLYSRSQRVALNRILSSPLPVEAGVPQSSVLGPLTLSHTNLTLSERTVWQTLLSTFFTILLRKFSP